MKEQVSELLQSYFYTIYDCFMFASRLLSLYIY